MSLLAPLRGIRAAAHFLTRIPVGGTFTARDWQWSTAWFPLVGAAIGALMALVFVATSRAGHSVAATMAVACSLLLTGAFHEDGLADTADALGGAMSRARLFEILKDSRVGTFGAAALVVSILLRVLLLTRLGDAGVVALVVSQSVSRAPPVVLMALVPYVTADKEAKSRLVTRARAPQALVAIATATLVLAVAIGRGHLSRLEVEALASASVAVTAVCSWRFRARAGGITGDFLGATQQLVELAVLLAIAIARG